MVIAYVMLAHNVAQYNTRVIDADKTATFNIFAVAGDGDATTELRFPSAINK